jgi:NADH-ubiquinone oxidoreductase chain 4L
MKKMNLSLILFLIGILGFVLNRKNIILMLISIEIMLLAITFLILVGSLGFDDILGQVRCLTCFLSSGSIDPKSGSRCSLNLLAYLSTKEDRECSMPENRLLQVTSHFVER